MTTENPNGEFTDEKRIDFLFKVIGRFDHYINSTNTKASIIIAWNGILIGAILLKFDDVLRLYQGAKWSVALASVLLSLIGICGLASIFIVFSVVFPFLEKTSQTPTGRVLQSESMIFFGSVAAMGKDTYTARVKECTSSEILSDISDQAVILAIGLREKMERLRGSITAIKLSVVLIIALVVIKGLLTITV